MLDETRTKCGLNGRNSDFVQNDGFVNPLKIRACGQRISSVGSLGRYYVRKIDGVSFGELSSDGIISFGRYDILKIFKVLKKFIVKFCKKQRQL